MAKKKEAVAEATTQGTVAAELDPKEVISKSLLKTGRKGVEDLIDYMEEIGFFDAPCSGGNHLCEPGGLARHSVNVMFTAEKLSVSLIGGVNITDEIRNSIVIAALLHDLGKCGDYGKALYVVNMIKDGRPTLKEPEQKYKQSEKKPWKRNPDLSNVPHAVRSIKIATLFIDLTEDEEWAILTHDGLYDFMMREIPGHETWLSMLIHWADMWSSHIIEGSTDEESEGE